MFFLCSFIVSLSLISRLECSKKKLCDLSDKSITTSNLTVELLKKCGNMSTTLQFVNVSNNKLTQLNMEVFKNFTDLQHITADSNYLTRIPSNIDKYVGKLKTLSLINNTIDDLTEVSARNLTKLDLSCNHISVLTGVFLGVPLLQELFLSRNKVQKIYSNTFKGLKNLKKLYLDGNSLDTLYSGRFDDLKNLQIISVAHNNIGRLRKGVFMNLPKLSEIYMNDNKINTLDYKSLNGMNLKRLDLQNNRIVRLKDGAFKNSKILGKINIRNNPIYCDCWLLSPILDKLRNNGEIQGNCNEPLNLKGKSITHLTHVQLVCKKIDSCENHECLNGGICQNVNNTFYTCECVGSFHGNKCQNAEDEDNTVMIILCVCLGLVVIAAIIIGSVTYARKKRNSMNRCISKEICCCFMILTVFFFLFALFVGLRVACKFHEYC